MWEVSVYSGDTYQDSPLLAPVCDTCDPTTALEMEKEMAGTQFLYPPFPKDYTEYVDSIS